MKTKIAALAIAGLVSLLLAAGCKLPQDASCDPASGAGGAGGYGGADGGAGGGALTPDPDTFIFCNDTCSAQCMATPTGTGSFSSAVFKFVTIKPDDGQDDGGGWQEAKATLKFADFASLLPRFWKCALTVGMPLRAQKTTITPSFAAATSAAIATTSAENVDKASPGLPEGIFCSRLKDEMNNLFTTLYKWMGARVTTP